MNTKITDKLISELMDYARTTALVSQEDDAYVTGSVMALLRVDDYTPVPLSEKRPLAAILEDVNDYAAQNQMLEADSVVFRDLYDTSIMGAMTPRPSEVIKEFYRLYSEDPKLATDYFYRLSVDNNYIRSDRISKDLKWRVESEFGEIDISVNLSKPEKDPKAIAAAKLLPPSGYPKCALCHENEGYRGTASKPARQNLRQIPFDMAGTKWYLQYSPYVYYNEHCIALSGEHVPMSINRSTFEKLLGFVEAFPHYFIGSNADLPIVGGSILSHDHMQGGRYTFAMERAPVVKTLCFRNFEDVDAGIIHWPLSVIRLRSLDKNRLVELADKILRCWRGYTDCEATIFAETDGTPHNTITPIARRNGKLFELDLTLRNNLTTAEHPLGLFHPHAEHHNIKKENIGLIEVMGLAVLPARLKKEIGQMCEAILAGKPFAEVEEIKLHAEWFDRFKDNYTFTPDNVEGILRTEIGKTFVRVLTDAGVFKTDESGMNAFLRFIDAVNEG